MFKVKFYGTRGSIPVCDTNYQEFGGNTSCISILREEDNRISIIDAGTGIRNLGKEMIQSENNQKIITIGFTHFHWDHIQGFPFFLPAYNPNTRLNILSVGKTDESELRNILESQMHSEFFPIPLSKMGGKFSFTNLGDEEVDVNGVKVRSIEQSHPGISYGLRIELNGTVLVICTDLEHSPTISKEIVEFCTDADLLIHEAQYTDEELKTKVGWGHSSYSQAIEVAESANAKMVVMTHHEPDHDDDFLKQQEKKCKDRLKNCALAREGDMYHI